MLTRETYAGQHRFNRTDSRTRATKPASEWIDVEVPAIIDAEAFVRVGALLAARNPRRTPPRVVSGPIQLTGLAVCATCGGGMTIRTGKSGRYRYYTCSRVARMGKSQCPGRTVRMDDLDALVLDTLERRVLDPAHLTHVLGRFIDADTVAEGARRERQATCRQSLTEAEEGTRRLMRLVETGAAEPDDPLFRERIAGLRLRRDELNAEIRLLEPRGDDTRRLTPAVSAQGTPPWPF